MGVISEAVRHLMAAGVTGDALVTAIADMEDTQKLVRSSAAVRQARYRANVKERNALRNVSNKHNNVTDDSGAYIARAGAPVCSNDFSNEKSKLNTPLPTVGTPKKSKASTPQEILSEVVSEKTAADVVAHRKALRKPLTPRAAELLAKSLAASGDAESAAATMIERGWQGYRADWDTPQARAGPARSNGGGWSTTFLELETDGRARESEGTGEVISLLPEREKPQFGGLQDDDGGVFGNSTAPFRRDSRGSLS